MVSEPREQAASNGELGDFLLKFGFGGVQNFIAQSRKTRDLAISSQLLSELARAAIEAAKNHGAELVWPADPSQACPHQAVLRLPKKSAAEVRACGEAMREAVKRHWRDIAGDALAKFHRSTTASGQANGQLEQTFETYWAAVPLNGNYEKAYQALTLAFEQRRFTRTFPQLPQDGGPFLRTCGQCGARAQVVQGPVSPWLDAKDRLCAPCAAKRVVSYDRWRTFPSTTELAHDRFFRDPRWDPIRATLRLPEEKWSHLAAAWAMYQARKPGESARVPAEGSGEDVREILAALEELQLQAGDEQEIEKALRAYESAGAYYALVCFDGDRMGTWFSGSQGIPEKSSLEDFQKQLSSALAGFAAQIRELAPPFGAHLVYAGGDDGLALLPLDALFPFMSAVLGAWEQAVRSHFCDKNHPGPTISWHASVVHEHQPLSLAVAALHRRLDATKELLDGDAFSVWAEPRAGSAAQLFARNRELEEVVQLVEAACNWRRGDASTGRPAPHVLTKRKTEALGRRLLHQLLVASEGFFDANGYCPLAPAFELEMRRIIARSGNSKDFADHLASFLAKRASTPYQPRSGCLERLRCDQAVQGALAVLAFLARELAWEEER